MEFSGRWADGLVVADLLTHESIEEGKAKIKELST